mgnify:CR=1 FL=1
MSHGGRYRITAATRGAGRGLTVDVLLLDELREHRDWLAWAALSKTTLARPDALICAVSNAGDDQSVVLNDLRARGIEAISRCRAEPIIGHEPFEPAGSDGASLADPSGGLFLAEYSAPEGCALDDPAGWVAAMPGLNIDMIGPTGVPQPAPITTEAVIGFLGTDPPAVFRTELGMSLADGLAHEARAGSDHCIPSVSWLSTRITPSCRCAYADAMPTCS